MPAKWIKEDPSVAIDRRIVGYNNLTTPNVIEKILIIKHKAEGIRLEVFSPLGILKNERAKALRDQLIAAGFEQENIRWFKSGKYKDKLSVKDEESLINFLSIVGEYETINDEIYKEILHELGIRKPEVASDKYQKLELSLSAAIVNGDQSLIDQLFHQLCGRKDMPLTFTNMRGDTHTLITLATHIRGIEEQLEQLKKPEEQPSQSTGPNFFSSS